MHDLMILCTVAFLKLILSGKKTTNTQLGQLIKVSKGGRRVLLFETCERHPTGFTKLILHSNLYGNCDGAKTSKTHQVAHKLES